MFADAKTLYVADEGNGNTTFRRRQHFTAAAASDHRGIAEVGVEHDDQHLDARLYAAGGSQSRRALYREGLSDRHQCRDRLPWSPATDGLRNITGHVNRDGTVTIWAITSTVSGGGDQGADPNKLVMITDKLAATTLPANENFTTVRTAKSGEVLRGVSFTPGTGLSRGQEIARYSATSEYVRRSIEEHDPEKCVAVFRRDHAAN